MPSDPDPMPIDRPGAEVSSGRPAESPRSLGRGLEQVSHLFLSQAADARISQTPDDRRLDRAALGARRSDLMLLRPRPPLSADQLTALLRESPGALEEGLRVIDSRLPCGTGGEIDLLALDSANQLTVIDLDTVRGDGLVMRGVAHIDWLLRHAAHVQRLYQRWPVDMSRPPRLLLIVPKLSPALRSAVRQITRPEICCFRYHSVEAPEATGVFFERAGGDAE
jgi:hypothetical protein